MSSPFVIVPALSAVAIKYRHQNFIADQVMPRVPVDKQQFISLSDRMADWMTPVDTTVGRTDAPKQMASSIQDPTYLATLDQGLDESVPNEDQFNGPNENALMRATQRIMGLVSLQREMRVAAVFNNLANFAYSQAYSTGTTQWSDYANSDPLGDILKYLDMCFARPNKVVMGRRVWTVLSQHPKLVHLANTSFTNGRISKQQFADLLEVDEIIVGDGWVNTAPKGQTANKVRIWGTMLAGVYQGNISPHSDGMWGYTAQFGARVAGTIVSPDIGIYGGLRVRAGESVREVVTAKEFGFLLTNVVTP